jgi:hypothetical protein
VNRPRAADDFAAIRARMKQLRYERERAEAAEIELRVTRRCAPPELDIGRSEKSTPCLDRSANPALNAARSELAGLFSDRAPTRWPAKGRRSIGTAGVSGAPGAGRASSPVGRRAPSS